MSIQFMICAFIAPQKIELSNNNVHKLIGKGPPVVFSSAFNGRLPSFMYSNFLNHMKQNVTVVLPNTREITSDGIKEIANALNVKRVGFVSHSSINPDILSSKFIERAVCIDPKAFPNIFDPSSQFVKPKMNVLVINTHESYFSFIDERFKLIVQDSSQKNYEEIGHVDILDDVWANAGRRVGFKGIGDFDTNAPKQSFDNWTLSVHKTPMNRQTFRNSISDDSIEHILQKCELV